MDNRSKRDERDVFATCLLRFSSLLTQDCMFTLKEREKVQHPELTAAMVSVVRPPGFTVEPPIRDSLREG